MVVADKLRSFLDEHEVRYHVLKHHERFTSPEIAQELHIPGQELAKVVMVNVDGKLVMGVVTANDQVDLGTLADIAGAATAELANEDEFQETFPDCELGATPPFGNLYDLDVYVDEALARDKEIVFEAGSHREAVKLTYADFVRLVKPTVGAIAQR